MNKRAPSKIAEYLQQLYLSTAARRYAQLAEQADKEGLTHEQYLLLVVREECEERRNKRIERYLSQSRLPMEKSLETYNQSRLPHKIREQIRVLIDGKFLDLKENILIFGNPGSGKTHLICAIAQELVRKDRRIYFTSCAMLLQELLSSKRELKLQSLIRKLNKYEGIIIDDIGYVHQDKEEMEVLFTLLAERYERGSVMITSNLPFSKWEKIFKDPVMTVAAIDRIVHHSIILELNLPSYRVSEAKNRKSQLPVLSITGKDAQINN